MPKTPAYPIVRVVMAAVLVAEVAATALVRAAAPLPRSSLRGTSPRGHSYIEGTLWMHLKDIYIYIYIYSYIKQY